MNTIFDMNEWHRIKDNLKNEYPELTDVDLDWGRVSREDLIQNISIKLVKTKKDLINEIESFYCLLRTRIQNVENMRNLEIYKN